MVTVSVADAKARLSELLDRVAAGEAISITRRGKATARLVPDSIPSEGFEADEMERMRKLSRPWVNGTMSFVEWARHEDLL